MMKNILIVDDDTDILKVLKANLQMHNFTIFTAETWEAAEELLSQEEINLIILDVMLPDDNGIEICRKLRGEDVHIPIIILTARDKVSDKVLGLDCGADDYVVKPFETLELVARIKACLRRTMEIDRDHIQIGDIQINKSRRLVQVRNNEVELTPKEYDLLLFFASNKGKVIPREKIKKSIWKDSSLYAWSRVIDVHVQHIRHKIEKDVSNPEYIITVPGVGYMFSPQTKSEE